MPLKNSFSEANGFQRMLILFTLILIGIIGLGVAVGFIAIITGNIGAVVNSINANSSMHAIRLMKVVQMLSQLLIFILPALGFAYLTQSNGLKYLHFDKPATLKNIGLAAIVTLLAIPFINLLGQWNMTWDFPSALSGLEEWMKATQQQNDDAIMAFSKMPHTADILTNILMMAIIPAIGEELLFRGIIQPQFQKAFKNHHVAIWVTAILFSAIHMQFYGFLSRMLLGAIFGYLYHYSKNLRLAMVAHFTNNMLALFLVIIFGVDQMDTNFEDPFSASIVIPSIALFAGSIAWLVYWAKNNRTKSIPHEN